jgi:hypothetical protein
MTNPIIPGYPAPAQPQQVQPQPQGYPGPAVAAPQPSAAMAMPQTGAPQGAYPAQPPALDLGAAIAGADPYDRTPQPEAGAYTLAMKDVKIRTKPQGAPNAGKRTLIVDFEVIESSNPATPVGTTAAYVEGLEFGMGRIQTWILANSGWASRAQFDEAHAAQGQNPVAALTAVVQGALRENQQSALCGKHVSATITDAQKQRKDGTIAQFKNWAWSPAPAAT